MQGVEQSLAGVASALLNTAQQIGAAVGLALLTAVALVASDRELAGAADVLPRAIADGDARPPRSRPWPCSAPATRRLRHRTRPRPGDDGPSGGALHRADDRRAPPVRLT